MRILFLSNSVGNLYSGPTYSIPKQVAAMSKYDEVIWINSKKSALHEWKQLKYYYDVDDFPTKKLADICQKTGKPDVIIIEQFYNHIRDPYLLETYRGDVPYVIVPRGEFTAKAQQRKNIKKSLANRLFAKRIIQKAAAVLYLSPRESDDSGSSWNSNPIVIPNGITIPGKKKENFSADVIRVVSIGRIEPYQKGIDILIEAVTLLKKENSINRLHFDLFGADVDGKAEQLRREITLKGLSDIIEIHGPAYGDEKERILLASDVYIMPSRFEGMPMALLEAMSYGLPCIVSEGSNMMEDVDRFEAGWTFHSEPEELVAVLSDCVSAGSNTLARFSSNAIKLASEYSWDTIAQKTHDMLCDLVHAV